MTRNRFGDDSRLRAWLGAIVVALCVGAQPVVVSAQGDQADAPDSAETDCAANDCREDLAVVAFSGISIDTFASADLKTLVNPEASGDVQEQLIGGFDFEYRLHGSNAPETVMEHHQQVWLYGEIVHGAVSGEASCTENTDAMGATTVVFNEAICNEASLKSTKPASANDRLALFRQATSLEAFGGIRYEFATLNRGTKNPANVYVKGQVGFLTVAAGGSDVKDIHHVGAGVVLTKGRLQDSYFEFGWGKNDVFADGEQRYKVDVFLSLGGGGAVSPFAQFVMDADFGPKADSIQSFFGVDIDIFDAWGSGN